MTTPSSTTADEERKRRRLEAWKEKQKAKQQQQQRREQEEGEGTTATTAPAGGVGGSTTTTISTSMPKITLSLGSGNKKKNKKKKKHKPVILLNRNETKESAAGGASSEQKQKRKKNKRNAFFGGGGAAADDVDADDEDSDEEDRDDWDGGGGGSGTSRKRKLPPEALMMMLDGDDEGGANAVESPNDNKEGPPEKKKKRKKRRWDAKNRNSDDDGDDERGAPSSSTAANRKTASSANAPTSTSNTTVENNNSISNKNDDDADDALDRFMDKLQAGEMGEVVTVNEELVNIQVSGSMIVANKKRNSNIGSVLSGGVITAEQIIAGVGHNSAARNFTGNEDADAASKAQARYEPSDWLSDASPSDTEDEEQARRALIEALKSAPVPAAAAEEEQAEEGEAPKLELASEVKTEKHRREEVLHRLQEQAKEQLDASRKAAAPDIGRFLGAEEESGGVMEEAERMLQAAQAQPDALVVLAELNKKKELGAVDHSSIDYLPLKKNLYRVPPSLANLPNDEVVSRRAKLKVRVRGHGAPAPIENFNQCGLSEKILSLLKDQNIVDPFPIQAQCIPTIMAGRDVIGIAKTGSGKTLAYLLPLLRHMLAQPPLAPNESGPIGLILAPARELAYQIHLVCKSLTKPLGLK